MRVRWAVDVDERFHARYSATSRRYLYLLHEADELAPLLHNQVVLTQPLDDNAMHNAARVLTGEHDFSSFRAAGCQSQSPYRYVHALSVRRAHRFVIIDITANAFLLHMVRNISGVLLDVGLGRREVTSIPHLLAARDRTLAGKTAPPQGLYLVDVRYPDQPFPVADLPPVLRVLGDLPRL